MKSDKNGSSAAACPVTGKNNGSCMVCQALLHDASKCTPCTHNFCKACISRFKDCPLCGADLEGIEPDAELQTLVDRFIYGHAQIERLLASWRG